MSQEDKQLLLKVLCAMLPYGVKLDNGLELRSIDVLTKVVSCSGSDRKIDYVRPYLRPMSSMTEEEEVYYNIIYPRLKFYEKEDWLNAHHFNYCLPPHLFIEAPEGMYKK